MRKLFSTGIFIVILTVACLKCVVKDGRGGAEEEAQFLTNIRQLTFEGNRAGEGYFSGDGKYLIFQSEREPGNPFFQIYILNFETGEVHRVSPGIGKTTCSFFRPCTNDVLFASTHPDPEAQAKQQAELEFRATGEKRRFAWDYDENYDIFSAKWDGSNLKRLTDAYGYDAEGAYSPDGNKIVFCSLRDAYPVEKLSPEDQERLKTNPGYFGEIYIMDADGSNQRRLTNWPGYDGGPFFSPDGKRIIWRHFEENGMLADIYTMRTDGSDVQRLTAFGAMSFAPYYHPSGKYVIFNSNKYGFRNHELFIVDTQGKKEPVRVTFNDAVDVLPVFSPDGRRLAWTSNRSTEGKKSQLFLAEWNHEAALEALGSAPHRMALRPSKSSGIPEGLKDTPDRSSANSPAVEEKGQNFSPEIAADDLYAAVSYLASDELEGRLTGTRGTELAADYIAGYFQGIGLKAGGENETYFQEFPFTAGVRIIPELNYLRINKRDGKGFLCELDNDFCPLAFTTNGHAEGKVVFAGYGLFVPGEAGVGYDSYAGMDVKDKIVLVLNYVPEEVDVNRRRELNCYAGLRYKAMLAREHGAKALLVVNGPRSPGAGELVHFSFDKVSADSGIMVASVSGKVARMLFEESGKDLEAIQSGLDVESPYVEGSFELPDIWIEISIGVEREKKTDRNIIGILPPAETSDDTEYIMVGAHYDHIGYGGVDSLARKGEEGQVHNGADDNASGVSVILELAAVLADEQRNTSFLSRRGIVFALWSGEEMGLLGSTYFAKQPTIPIENIIAYLNFDMVGRLREDKLVLQGTGSSGNWAKLVEKYNTSAGLRMILQEDPYLPTDATVFYSKGIPVVNFFTGSHEDYNRPTDDPDTLNYDGMVKIAKFAKSLIVDLAKTRERPHYAKVDRAKGPVKERASLRIYLGTIPDFTSEDIEGLKLSSVRGGGPADRAGLKDGDVIIELAGQRITNIYDYKYVLDALKVGEPSEVVILRDGKRIKLTIVPELRK